MKHKNLLLAIVLIITFITHASFIFNGFTWLDHNDLELKRAVSPMSEIASVFFRPFGETSFYRPLVTIVNSIDYALYNPPAGGWAPGFHLTNVLLHLTVVALTPLFIIQFININFTYLLLAALIVGVHPSSIMVAGLIIQRQESLLLIFTMLTMIFYIKATQNIAIKYKLITWISFAAALSSKETALFVVPALIIFWELTNINALKKIIRISYLIPVGIVLIIYLLLRFTAVPHLWGTKFTPLPLDQAIATRLGLTTKWLLILVSPFKPNFSDSVPVIGLLSPEVFISLAVILIGFLIVIKYKVHSDIGKSILLLFIMLAPGLNLVPVPRVGSPHYAYLPTVAVSAAVLIVIAHLKNNLKTLAYFILAVWIIIASATSFQSGFQFKNDLTLFAPEITRDPDFIEGYYYLGNYYLKAGDLKQAALNYELGLVDRPNILAFRARRWIIMNLAGVRFQQNRFTEAEQLYGEALDGAEESLKPYLTFNQALAAYKMDNHTKVVELLEDLYWDRPEAYLLLAKSYHAQGRWEEEIATLKKALPFLAGPEKVSIEMLIKDYEEKL